MASPTAATPRPHESPGAGWGGMRRASTVATSRHRKTPTTRGQGATGGSGGRVVARLSLRAAPLADRRIAPYSGILARLSPRAAKSCGST
jgi:hypothetical protein